MNRNALKNGLALLLAVCFVMALVPSVNVFAEDNEPVIVIAGSDFQAETGQIGSENVSSIISSIKQAGYETADGFLFAGDYDVDFAVQSDSVVTLKETVKTAYPELSDEDMVFVQGNHDEAGTEGINPTGANDTEDYGVFVINEDDFPWYGGSESHTKALAEKLRAYLEVRADEKKEQPVFVVSHLPLHYSYRTLNAGDCKYAEYLFDVLNEYGESLNIVFLFGHNHSAPFDDYIGGSAIYLAKGDKIYISKTDKYTETPDEYVLNFTYMNAGYVGYTWCLGNELTMTVFEIHDNMIKVKRYGANGEYPLKTKGEWSSYYDDSAATYGTTESYLNIAYENPQYIGNTAEDGDVKIYSSGITGLTVTESKTETVGSLQTAYARYDIQAEGVKDGDTAAVIIDLNRAFLDARPIFIRDINTGEITCRYAENGVLSFETEHLSSYELTQHRNAVLSKTDITVYKAASELADGKSYIITTDIAEGKTFAIGHKDTVVPIEAQIHEGFGSTYLVTDDTYVEWTFQKNTTFGYAENVGTLKNTSTGEYLCSLDGATLSTVATPISAYGVWRVSTSAYGMYTPASPDSDARNYIKYHSGFIISESLESSARVYVFEKTQQQLVISAYLDTASGGVDVGADADALTGIKLYLVGNDGTRQVIDVTASMLKTADGKSVDTSVKGVYDGLTVYYEDTAIYTESMLCVGKDVTFPSLEDEASEESVQEVITTGSEADTSDNSEATDSSYIVWIVIGVLAAVMALICVILVLKKNKK